MIIDREQHESCNNPVFFFYKQKWEPLWLYYATRVSIDHMRDRSTRTTEVPVKARTCVPLKSLTQQPTDKSPLAAGIEPELVKRSK